MKINQEKLKALLHYSPDSGKFTWLVDKPPRIKAGDEAGTLRDDGYIRIQLDGERRYAAHWAWLYMTGTLPVDEVDHIDRKRANNAWLNLRAATKSQNCANRAVRVADHGFRGVTKFGSRYKAQIVVNKTHKYLGLYDTPEEAHAAWASEAAKHHGSFAMITANDNEQVRRAAA